jgi:hypothetical protein
MNFWEKMALTLFISFFAFLGLACIYGVVGSVIGSRAQAVCLKAGFPRADMDWKFSAYCVKREEYTDVVVPLKEIQNK